MAYGDPLNNRSFKHQGDDRKHHLTAFKETNLSNPASRRKGIRRLAQVIPADKLQNMVKSTPPGSSAARDDHSGVRRILIRPDASSAFARCSFSSLREITVISAPRARASQSRRRNPNLSRNRSRWLSPSFQPRSPLSRPNRLLNRNLSQNRFRRKRRGRRNVWLSPPRQSACFRYCQQGSEHVAQSLCVELFTEYQPA